MKKALLFTAFLMVTALGMAQISYEKRIEFELRDGYEGERFVEFGKKGILMCSEKAKSDGKETEWKYELFNLQLEQVKERSISLSKKYFLDETFDTENRRHTLYRDRSGDFSIVSVDVPSLEITTVDGSIPKKAWILDMAILGDYAYFNATLKKSPFLFSVNWKTGEQNFIPIRIPGYKDKKLSLMDFQVLEDSREILLYVKAQPESNVYIVKLNDKGQKEDFYNLSENIDNKITDISASNIGNGKYIFSGTYSSSTSEGLFFCQARKDNIDFIEYYNFLDMENFLSFLSEKSQEKIEKKRAKKEKKGKGYKLNYKFAIHDVMPVEDGYLFLCEAYYPTYRTETYTTTTTVNGVTRTTTQTRRVFDGYQYTHAVLAKFDQRGKLLWDEIFEMWPSYKPFYVKRFISVAEQDQNKIKMVFASRNKIVAKTFDMKGSVIQDKESEEIKTDHHGDKLKYSFSNITYWYDNYFIAYGTQTIKNTKDKKVRKKRKVLFLSKVKYD